MEVLDGPPGSPTFGTIRRGLNLYFQSSSNIMTIKYSGSPDHPASPFDVRVFPNPKGE